MRLLVFTFALLTVGVLPSFAQESGEQETIGLDKLIRAVVNDISRASNSSSSNGNGDEAGTPVFTLGRAELELKFTLKKTASGKVEAHFWSVGASAEGSAASENVQTIRLKLLPFAGENGKPNVQFSSLKPGDAAILLDGSTYADFSKSAVGTGIEVDPIGVNASALGVATDGVVVSQDVYNKVLGALKKADPDGSKLQELERAAVPVTVPARKTIPFSLEK